MSDYRLTSDIPFGEFEGAPIQAYAAPGKNSRLHATSTCPKLSTTDVQSLSVQLNAATVDRMCVRCASWGRWTDRDSALGIFFDSVLGNGLLSNLDSYGSSDPDDPDENDITRAAETLNAQQHPTGASGEDDQADDGEDEQWEQHREAESVRDRLLTLWRTAADSLCDASMVVNRYPWLEDWARLRLDAKVAYVEDVRRSLATLVDPRILLEAAAVHAIEQPEQHIDQPGLATLGEPVRVRAQVERAWREWSRRVQDDWRSMTAYDYLAYEVVNGDKPRRRKGRKEALEAITELYALWAARARERADMSASTEERIVVAVIPEADLRPEYGGRERASFDNLLSYWQLGVLAAHTVATDWAHRTMLLRLPALAAHRLIHERSKLECHDVTADASLTGDTAAQLSQWITANRVASAAGPLPGVFDDTPVSGRRLLTRDDVKVLRKTIPRGDQPCLVFSVEDGVEGVLLSTLEERCASGWRGVLLAGPNDLPAALIDPWSDDVREVVRAATADDDARAWREEPSSASDPDFGAHLGARAGELDMGRYFHSTPRNHEDLEQLLRILAVARAVDDLRGLGGRSHAEQRPLPPAVWRALLTIRQPDLTPFQPAEQGSWRWEGLGLPLSVLTHVQVYTTVGSSWYGRGKGHAPHCQHADRFAGGLDSGYELLTLAEILVQEDYDWCSKCGGYAIRRLSEAQVRYYRAAHRLCEINSALESHLINAASPADRHERAAALSRELDELARLRPDPPIGPYDDGNTAWHSKVNDIAAKVQRVAMNS